MNGNGTIPDPATIKMMVEEARGLALSAEHDVGLPFEPANLDLLCAIRTLDPAAWQRVRAMLKMAKVPVGDLDKLIAAKLGEGGNGEADGLPGSRLDWPEDEPWPDPVDGAAVLSEIAAELKRFVVLQPHAAETVALWVFAAHALDAFDIFPRLAITSPTSECGKSTLLAMLKRLIPRPLQASNTTAAAVFRAIEMAHPSLLIDEGDSFIGENNELRGILNSGHARDGAFVLRVVGDDHEPRMFSTWAAMAVALIGALPPTLASRSLHIRMQRRLKGERIERLRGDRSAELFDRLRRQAARWAEENVSALRAWRGDAPEALGNRTADNWRPLVAVAANAGAPWPMLAETAALSSGGEVEAGAAGVQVLADLLTIFKDETELPTRQLLTALSVMEERPWSQWGRARKPITDIQLGRLLKPFAIRSKTIRFDTGLAKGYERDPIADAWARYGISDFQPVTPEQTSDINGLDPFSTRNTKADVTGSEGQKAEQYQRCNGVTGQNVPNPPRGGIQPETPLDRWRRESRADDDLLNQEEHR